MLRASRLILQTVDYHTGGEPFRIVTGGAPFLRGGTILERRRDAMARFDHIRRFLVNEPRGHADMYGCFVTPPDNEDGDLGVVFFHNSGYSTACGHGTIALATWAIESGVFTTDDPETQLLIDVPSGRVEARVSIVEGKVHSVTFRNVPAYVEATGIRMDTIAGPLTADVAFGGAFYACVSTTSIGVSIDRDHLPILISLGRDLKSKLERAHTFVHPSEPELRDIYGVIFYENLPGPAGELHQRNVTIFADGEVDRSPCGSGTSARLAILDAAGQLARGDPLVHKSIIDTTFLARVVHDTSVGGRPAVITDVEGSAFLTGFHSFILLPEDPLDSGFLLR